MAAPHFEEIVLLTLLHAKLAGFIAGLPGQLRDAAGEKQAEFAKLVSQIPVAPEGVVRRTFRKLIEQ